MCKHLIASTAKTVAQVLILIALGAMMYWYVDAHHNEPTVSATDTELSSKATEDSLFKAELSEVYSASKSNGKYGCYGTDTTAVGYSEGNDGRNFSSFRKLSSYPNGIPKFMQWCNDNRPSNEILYLSDRGKVIAYAGQHEGQWQWVCPRKIKIADDEKLTLVLSDPRSCEFIE